MVDRLPEMEARGARGAGVKRLVSLLFHDVYVRDPDESGFTGAAANRYKLPLQAFLDQLDAVRRGRTAAPVLINRQPVAGVSGTPFAITVDDGGLSYHSIVADSLESYGWRGHCLVTTGRLNKPGFLHKHHVRELHDRGHVIGSHSVTHPSRFNELPWVRLVDEWRRSKAVLEDTIGSEVIAGSVPGGYYAPRVARAARAAGLSVLFTSEPETRLRRVEGCRVIGRYALRQGCRADLAGCLVGREPTTLCREWLFWNGKKALKASLGDGYARLVGWAARASG